MDEKIKAVAEFAALIAALPEDEIAKALAYVHGLSDAATNCSRPQTA